MPRRSLPFLLLALAAGCAERDLPTSTPQAIVTPRAGIGGPRERLAARLAVALDDPAVRAALANRIARSRAPEGKLQFQALARADRTVLLAALTRAGGTVADVLADLDAARGLEVYLPVAAHRAAWGGGADVLVATIGADGEAPVAFDTRGGRRLLSPIAPPATPVIALVPQETDFTGGRPALATTCWDMCSGDDGGGSAGTSGYTPPGGSPGLYLTTSHFEDSFESWLKGKPEYEYHVYAVDGTGNAEQLSCAGEHAGGAFGFDQNERDWSGSVMLLSEQDRAAYEQRSPGKPVRVVAFEDDDEACVPRLDADRLTTLIKAVDAAYKVYTSGKVEPLLFRGIKAAPSVFSLVKAIYSAITTGDDFIGNAVETSVAGWMPGGANWSLKTEGTKTTGWFSTTYVR